MTHTATNLDAETAIRNDPPLAILGTTSRYVAGDHPELDGRELTILAVFDEGMEQGSRARRLASNEVLRQRGRLRATDEVELRVTGDTETKTYRVPLCLLEEFHYLAEQLDDNIGEYELGQVIGRVTSYQGTEFPFMDGNYVKILAVMKDAESNEESDYLTDDDAIANAGGINPRDRLEVAPWIEQKGRFSFVTSDARAIDLGCFGYLVPVPKCPFCLVKRDRRTIWEPRWARVADRDGDLYQLASTVSRIRL
ncbi:MAG: hypothetical protein MJE77_16965, partial [Proteobacteria bacterium]|nr:hypothetical protein [Pseudomonadota bacterium]